MAEDWWPLGPVDRWGNAGFDPFVVLRRQHVFDVAKLVVDDGQTRTILMGPTVTVKLGRHPSLPAHAAAHDGPRGTTICVDEKLARAVVELANDPSSRT